MVTSGRDLQRWATEIAPELGSLLDSPEASTTWGQPLKSGKAIEVLSFALLFHSAKTLGLEVALSPYLQSRFGAFYVNNQIPMHYGAQPGNSALGGRFAIEDSFQDALQPRLIIEGKGSTWSVFREGHPLHQALFFHETGRVNSRRPDWVVVQGDFTVDHPEPGQIRMCWHRDGGVSTEVVLAMQNAPEPILISEVSGGIPAALAPIVLMECSLSKSRRAVDRQLAGYGEVFAMSLERMLFVHAGSSSASHGAHTLCLDRSKWQEPPLEEWSSAFSAWLEPHLQVTATPA